MNKELIIKKKEFIIKKMVSKIERLNLNVTDLHFEKIVNNFTSSQISEIVNFNQIVSQLWLSKTNKILRIQVWDLTKNIDTSIIVEFPDIPIYKEQLDDGRPYDEDLLCEVHKGLLVFFSIINKCDAIICNSYYHRSIGKDGNPMNCCNTIQDFINNRYLLEY